MQDESSWTCARCRSSNASKAKFCGECGTGRHATTGLMANPQSLRKVVTVLFADLKGLQVGASASRFD